MPCCGQNRETLRSSYPAVSQPVVRATAPQIPGVPATRVRYVRGGHVLVRGPQTGWQYEFSPAGPVQSVDPRDAESLVSTGLFARAV
jgi:hypothetical protein